MDSISLPYGTAHVKFSVITHLFAAAMCPPPDESGVRPGYDAVRSVVDRKLSRAVEVGDLSAKDPLTLAPHRYPVGDALREAVVGVDELRQYAARHGLPTINPVVRAAGPSACVSLERAV
jgi:hypothetical protein